ncbi:hypothetical protein CC78DRAFT_555512 [Lojkania enalia]|uniref:UbiA prenyltransferase n=1 Tax=Lojkania enalia TaxID=147567 RepID=A0A9P4K6Z2_9PLEO|nr:hypothetical protein CC78DRAFT_555512 [Didymosphaeria enalia]
MHNQKPTVNHGQSVISTKLPPAYTIWLFTHSDLKTIVGPSTFFAIVCAKSGPVMMGGEYLPILLILRRVPITAFWVWCNLLPFAIDNQRQHGSVIEDEINKPWRPLPSKRLSQNDAVMIMLLFYAFAVLISLYLRGLLQCFALMGLGYWYNDQNGADCHFITRNFINSCGYVCFASGALEVISNRSIYNLHPAAYQWLLIISIVIFTTIHSQDMADQEGDFLRSRWTLPLVIGDTAARTTLAVSLGIWSVICPAFWQLSAKNSAVTYLLGIIVGIRFLFKRYAEADKISFQIYNLWIVSIFSLPLLRSLSGP